MRRSTEEEIQEVRQLVLATRAKIQELLQQGKKVHVIWDFDGVLTDSRSDDVFTLTNRDLEAYFLHEERLLLQSPDRGHWLLSIAHNTGITPHFLPERFTQDIVTSRSSFLAIRVTIFCIMWRLPVRWTLSMGHQSKKESYRIILQSLQNDPDYFVFCVDDSARHIEAFGAAALEEKMAERTCGIVSPVVRTYTEGELREYLARVMNATGNAPIRVRDPSDDMHGFLVIPGGVKQFCELTNHLVSEKQTEGSYSELRDAFIRTFGEIESGYFKTEEELERAMKDFITGLHCP